MRARAVTLFDDLPEGFVYRPEFITPAEEQELLSHIEPMEFSDVRMRGAVARRRVRQFGWHYSFNSYRLTQTEPLPQFLLPLREKTASLVDRHPDDLTEALITEYRPGATIGWHRDAGSFGIVIGVSLRASCTFKLRREASGEPPLALGLAPRSIYVLDGPARRDWQHSIPPTRTLRYSVTFRTIRRRAG